MATRDTQPKPPRFAVGQSIDDLIVVAYLGHGDINPERGNRISGNRHWYRVRCTCGREEVASQHSLLKKVCCNACAIKRRKEGGKRERRVVDPGVPNFLTMRLRG